MWAHVGTGCGGIGFKLNTGWGLWQGSGCLFSLADSFDYVSHLHIMSHSCAFFLLVSGLLQYYNSIIHCLICYVTLMICQLALSCFTCVVMCRILA
jgi:hypothetical protein